MYVTARKVARGAARVPAVLQRSVAGTRSVTSAAVPITVAYGDGIGPEIMTSTMKILEAAGANLQPEIIEIGESLYRKGHSSGIASESWDSLRRTKVFLKAPITTPSGGGYKSLNVTIRKTLGLFANVRPCVAYHPYIQSRFPSMDVTIVRENEEDLYAGIEHRQTNEVYQCLKIVSRPACERIVRYAFEYARQNNRKKVTCVVKDNIMKLTDGLFYKVFEEIGRAEYPDVPRERIIVDIGAAMLADKPERFDVMVMPNLYGDILSDIAAQITGSVGLGASANIGEHVAMFEAIHGSAPDIAGKDMANPSGLLLAAVQMLTHVQHPTTAAKIYNAWLRTIEDGFHTPDIFNSENPNSKNKVGTADFTKAIIDRLGLEPQNMKPAKFHDSPSRESAHKLAENTQKWTAPPQEKLLTGCDIFLEYAGDRNPDKLAAGLKKAAELVPSMRLSLITNRGVKVWPEGFEETFKVDHWRTRWLPTKKEDVVVKYEDIMKLMSAIHDAGFDVIKTENLCYFKNVDGTLTPGYSMGQGE